MLTRQSAKWLLTARLARCGAFRRSSLF
jgi:hypothetical protein